MPAGDCAVTTFARATREHDPAHERALLDAIATAIVENSRVSNASLVLRPVEIIGALTVALASTISLTEHARSPTAARKFIDGLSRRLRLQTGQAAADPDAREFRRRIFNGLEMEVCA
jgi:hypothetical protein